MLRTHRAGKGSRNRRFPGVPPTPGLRGRGTSPGSPAGFLGSSGRGKHPPLLSCSSVPEGPSHLPLLISPASLLCPQDLRGLDGALEVGGQAWELSRLPGPSGPGIALSSSPAPPGESLPPASPDLRGIRGADPVWPPLLLPAQSPYLQLVHSHLLGRHSPAPVAGRRPRCGETLTPRLSTPPSSPMLL